MSLLEALENELAKNPEIIGGTNINDVIEMVDLSIAHSPVVEHRQGEDCLYAIHVPVVREAIPTQGGDYVLTGDSPESVSKDSLQVMRARFLLTRDLYYQLLLKDALSHSAKGQVIARFFGGQVYIPKAGPLRDAMISR